MIEIEEGNFGFDNHCKWLLSDESTEDMMAALGQLYAQMMGWA